MKRMKIPVMPICAVLWEDYQHLGFLAFFMFQAGLVVLFSLSNA